MNISSSSSMPSAAAVNVSFAKDEKKRLTAYEKLLYAILNMICDLKPKRKLAEELDFTEFEVILD